MKDRLATAGVVLVAVFSVAGFIGLFVESNDTTAPRRALTTEGYTDAKVQSGSMWGEWSGCTKEEIAYDASAINPRGARVNVVVCCGALVKACTVRVK